MNLKEIDTITIAIETASDDLNVVESIITAYSKSKNPEKDLPMYKASLEQYCDFYQVSTESMLDNVVDLAKKVWDSIVATIKALLEKVLTILLGPSNDNSVTSIKGSGETNGLSEAALISNPKYRIFNLHGVELDKVGELSRLEQYIRDYTKSLGMLTVDVKGIVKIAIEDNWSLDDLEEYTEGRHDDALEIRAVIDRIIAQTPELITAYGLEKRAIEALENKDIFLIGTSTGFGGKSLTILIDNNRSQMRQIATYVDYSDSPAMGDIAVPAISPYNKQLKESRKNRDAFLDFSKKIIQSTAKDLKELDKSFNVYSKKMSKDEDADKSSLNQFTDFMKTYANYVGFVGKYIPYVVKEYTLLEGFYSECRKVYVEDGHSIDKDGFVK